MLEAKYVRKVIYDEKIGEEKMAPIYSYQNFLQSYPGIKDEIVEELKYWLDYWPNYQPETVKFGRLISRLQVQADYLRRAIDELVREGRIVQVDAYSYKLP